eukprot:gb/GEZN01002659.1/.p1 GENE.gb/GEZN01002659.1/~~gb/GEZN01002659.1/.p1  ORF type:complete len:594 (-),score=89.74 gb/GEZN01002659.1/:568-2349(-)
MGFCTKCGNQMGADTFCGKCGAPAPGEQIEGYTGNTNTTDDPGSTIQRPLATTAWENASTVKRRFDGPDSTTGVPVEPVVEGLKAVYKNKLLKIEEDYKYAAFASPTLNNVDFDAKPMVLLVGQYSTGKTSFIKYLLERDFPGGRIGHEPTTDRFMAVMYGPEKVWPGNSLAVHPDKPFAALQQFGMSFLNRFEGSECKSQILKSLTFIDTPGILSGEKQRIGRSYDFPKVVEWFAERADRIILLFDAHKLDISDEFKRVIESLAGHDDKIRCILNKADMVDKQGLMRVYGALMWSLGRIFKTPEVVRVYLGSFWDQPYQYVENGELLEAEEKDLLADLRGLPRGSAVRKVNDLVKRARVLKVHVLIIDHLRAQFGFSLFTNNKKKQEQLLAGLLEQFKEIQAKHNLPMGDFPHVGKFREKLRGFAINKFPKLEEKTLAQLDEVIKRDIPRLMQMLPKGDEKSDMAGQPVPTTAENNPFVIDPAKTKIGLSWVVDGATKNKYDNQFFGLKLSEGKLSGAEARPVLLASRLPESVLKEIWDLADIDQDSFLDADEFSVALWLVEAIQAGKIEAPPSELKPEMIPPSKRHLFDAT